MDIAVQLFTTFRISRILITLLCVLALYGCARQVQDGPPPFQVDASKIPNATPRRLPKSQYGNPSSYVAQGRRYYVLPSAKGYEKQGIASWYGTKFHGQLTSTREPYDMLAMTGASPVLPIPCFARVTNLENGKSIIVKINDRGPFAPHRIIDLSYVAAKKLGYANKGTAGGDVKVITVDAVTHPPVLLAKNVTPSNHRQLYLQLGVFRDLSHAEMLKAKIIAMMHKSVSIHKGALQHAPIYRVQIGPLVNVTESHRLQATLKKYGFSHAITINS